MGKLERGRGRGRKKRKRKREKENSRGEGEWTVYFVLSHQQAATRGDKCEIYDRVTYELLSIDKSCSGPAYELIRECNTASPFQFVRIYHLNKNKKTQYEINFSSFFSPTYDNKKRYLKEIKLKMRQNKGKRKSDKVAEKRHEVEYIASINSLTSGDI